MTETIACPENRSNHTPTATNPGIWSNAGITPTASNDAVYASDIVGRQLNNVLVNLVQRIAGLSADDPEIEAPSESTVTNASTWIVQLHSASRFASLPWKDPHITGNYDGQVVFEWWNGDKKLTVRFDDEGHRDSKMWGAAPNIKREKVRCDTRVEMQKLWRWLSENE